jgi:small ligand-binding sensory domain FIST
VAEVVERAQAVLGVPADLGFVFISTSFASEFPRLLPLLEERLPYVPLVGCSGGGIVGMSQHSNAPSSEERPQEIEDDEPALCLMLASLPEVEVYPFYVEVDDLPDMDSSPDAWVEAIGVSPKDRPHFVLLADPFSGRLNDLLQGMDYAYPDSVKVGGLASGGAAGNNVGLFSEGEFEREGVVGVALTGNIVLESIVAQGCRPIGQPFRVTESDRNIVITVEAQAASEEAFSAGGATVSQKRTPLEVLQNLIQNLDAQDRELAQRNYLFVGIAQNEFKSRLEQGDFLIRNLLGVDPRVGAIAISDRIRPGQRIQFHLRDAETSAEDLEMLLKRYQRETQEKSYPTGALMFTCVGRGEGLYDKPNFDSELFNRYLPNVPIAGFFCSGEIGPVGNSTFLHGYTSVFGIFRQP